MTTEITVDPELTATLRREIVELWVSATNAGGSVGFLPPTTAAVVRPVANQMFRELARGAQHLVVDREGNDLQGWVVSRRNLYALCPHKV
jgi:hypothetical protein